MIYYFHKNMKRPITIILVCILFAYLFMVNHFVHLDLTGDAGKLYVKDQVDYFKTELNQKSNYAYTEYQVILNKIKISEYEYENIDDIHTYTVNFKLIEHHQFLIWFLVLLFVVCVDVGQNALNKRSQIKKSLLNHFLIGMLFALILMLSELVFSLIIGFISLDFKSFFQPVLAIRNDHIEIMSFINYVLITRFFYFIQIAVICMFGVFASRIFNETSKNIVL
ncbi:hypothetical protein IC619_011805 [Hazenella sp. IB182353]|uniref:hypothetical protein n=1 Tax=Polycladospora coralii TaxID=2771432 RepID=UPI0017476D56|nr:hypothetical protein [Polycladospora coralii]MBS7531181.1 hypothetical protein [Polycladospora coralii]